MPTKGSVRNFYYKLSVRWNLVSVKFNVKLVITFISQGSSGPHPFIE